VADIGGYLGLFLGLSVFSLFEMLEVLIDKVEKKEDAKIAAAASAAPADGEAAGPLKDERNGFEFVQKNA